MATKQYVDVADDELQDQIALLAAAMMFVGSIDVVTDTGTYTAFSGFTNGPLPLADATNKGFYVIVSVGGTAAAGNIPPGDYAVGDWIISDGAVWVSIPIGQSNVIAPNVALSPPVGGWDDVQEAIEGLQAAASTGRFLPLTGGTITGDEPFKAARAVNTNFEVDGFLTSKSALVTQGYLQTMGLASFKGNPSIT